MSLPFPVFNPTKGHFKIYKNVNFSAVQVFGSVCWKPDFVCFIWRKYQMKKLTVRSRRH